MAIIGPRPLMTRYLPYYSEFERKRHTVRPGLTGYAQIHGRNIVNWSDRFALDIEYVENISLFFDVKIIIDTILIVIRREGIDNEDMVNFDSFRIKQWEVGEEFRENTILHH